MANKNFWGSICKGDGLPDRVITCIASTDSPDYVRDRIDPAGMTSRSGDVPVFWMHDQTQPIGRAAWRYDGRVIRATVTFAPAGVSEVADRACALVKAGILTDVSVGFDPLEVQPIKGGGTRYVKSRLLEISIVSVGCNPEAIITSKRLNSDKAARLRTVEELSREPPMSKAERLAKVAEFGRVGAQQAAAIERLESKAVNRGVIFGARAANPEVGARMRYAAEVEAARRANPKYRTREERMRRAEQLRHGP